MAQENEPDLAHFEPCLAHFEPDMAQPTDGPDLAHFEPGLAQIFLQCSFPIFTL